MSRGQFLSILVFLYLIGSPVLAGYIVTSAQGIAKDTIISYDENAIQVVSSPYTIAKNSSYIGKLTQDSIFDNDTLVWSIPTLEFADVASVAGYRVGFAYNLTAVDLSDIYKIEITYAYVGTGNITTLYVYLDSDYGTFDSQSKVLRTYTDDLEENSTIVIELESFESLQIENYVQFEVMFTFDDSNNFPSTNDYFEIRVLFYKKDTAISRETLISWVVGGLAFCNIIIAFASTKYWNPMKQGKYDYQEKKAYKRGFFRGLRLGFRKGFKKALWKLRRKRFWRRRRRY